MSRSRKKKPIVGITCANSEKFDKVTAHRRERRAVNAAIDVDPESAELLHEHEFSDPWTYAKDGKQIWDEPKGYRK